VGSAQVKVKAAGLMAAVGAVKSSFTVAVAEVEQPLAVVTVTV
jgi:hypothetical protein